MFGLVICSFVFALFSVFVLCFVQCFCFILDSVLFFVLFFVGFVLFSFELLQYYFGISDVFTFASFG